MADSPLILFAGGGTGGHVYPGLALAAELQRQRADLRLAWVGTRGRVEERAVPRAGIPIHYLDVAFLKGRRGMALARAAAGLPRAGWQALSLLRSLRPAAVVGLGGFVSGPICAAAAAMGIPVFLLEQNATPGITNRTVGRLATRIFASFEASRAHFPAGRVEVPGNPVRRELLGSRPTSRPNDGEGSVHVLVVGGSQGARSLNERTPALARALADEGIAVSWWHAAGPGALDATQEHWKAAGIEARVDAYIDDMASAYAWADLVICRSGATTIAELTALGVPALYVPFPLAADDHQTANARAVVEQGGGVMVRDAEYGDDRTVRLVSALLRHPQSLRNMANAASALGRPDAGARIAEAMLQMLAHNDRI